MSVLATSLESLVYVKNIKFWWEVLWQPASLWKHFVAYAWQEHVSFIVFYDTEAHEQNSHILGANSNV